MKTTIEPLELRIAPATLAGQVLTYSDIDGDQVTITISKGTLTAGMFAFDAGSVNGDNDIAQQLWLIDLSAAVGVEGANITMKVKKIADGDGLAAVGRINGGTNNLGTVTIKGDLGDIDCGNNSATAPAIKSLNVRSMGAYGLNTQGNHGGDNLVWIVFGGLGKLTIARDLQLGQIYVSGGKDLGSVFIGGSVIGGPGVSAGSIFVDGGNLGSVTVKGDIVGGGAQSAGSIGAIGNVGNVTIGGSLIGGAGPKSGWIFSGLGGTGNMGTVKIAHDMSGGSGATSGAITCRGNFTSLSIGGSLVGSSNADSGSVTSDGDLGVLKIGHDVLGGSGVRSAFIESAGKLGSVSIGGSVVGGSNAGSGRIASAGDMGAVKIGRDVQGSSAETSGVIESDGALASISIGGSLLGSASPTSGRISSLGDMGAVKIGHDVLGGGDFSGGIRSNGKLASLSIGGSLIGGGGSHDDPGDADDGQIFAKLDMGPVKVGHDVLGGAGLFAGAIRTGGKLASLSIGGSLVGGAGSQDDSSSSDDGQVSSKLHMGPVKIGADVLGGSGPFSGTIKTTGKLASISIGGSLIGGTPFGSGTAFGSGVLLSTGNIGAVKIGHDLAGGSISGSQPNLTGSGLIQSTEGRIAGVTIGGSVLAGRDDSIGGDLSANAAIRAGLDIGSVSVKGSVVGTVGNGGDITPVVFLARGQATPTATTDLAIGKLTVGGHVQRLDVFAGYDIQVIFPENGNAQIGAVSIGGDFVASNLIAGVEDGGAAGFGDAGDTIIGGLANSIAKIARINIKGVVVGTTVGGDQFGIASHAIGSLKINGSAVSIVSPVPLSPITLNDVTVRLV